MPIVQLDVCVDTVEHLMRELDASRGTFNAGRWSMSYVVDDVTYTAHAILPSFTVPFRDADTRLLVYEALLAAIGAAS